MCVQARIEQALSASGFTESFVFTGSRTDAKINSFDHPAVVELSFPCDDTTTRSLLEPSVFKQRLNTAFASADDEISVTSVRFIGPRFVFNKSVLTK